MDDAEKIDEECAEEIAMAGEVEGDSSKLDGSCPEVIKVYIFKADPGEEDLGKKLVHKIFHKMPIHCAPFLTACILIWTMILFLFVFLFI